MSAEQIPFIIESYKRSCAIEGLHELRNAIDSELESLQASEPGLALVSGDYVHSPGITPIFPADMKQKKKRLSEAVKNKISKAQKDRWKGIRQAQASSSDSNTQVVGLSALLSNEHHI